MNDEMTKIMVRKKVKVSISLLVCFKIINSLFGISVGQSYDFLTFVYAFTFF